MNQLELNNNFRFQLTQMMVIIKQAVYINY